jgi:hypothetical protein
MLHISQLFVDSSDLYSNPLQFNLLIRFDEYADTDEFFTWNKIEIIDDELQQLKKLFL